MNSTASEETDREFPCRRKVPLRSWIWQIFFACLPFLYFAMWLNQRTATYLTCTVVFSILAVSQYRTMRKKLAEPFRVGTFRAGFRNHITFNFAEVSKIDETMDHMDIHAPGLFGITRTRLVRHSFLPTDWDELTDLVVAHTREWNRTAKITRVADRVDPHPSEN
ncbi:hypothetical protein HAHE_26290 [Haloferula helveola]|uniref:PH domain-containing protein n=1 Tax=Haloferula helveola TaxID=490095 RepID=A0ABN6H505_9BACT|nr:hypothetical protein HAHE_26290 [Haloferula helveola]